MKLRENVSNQIETLRFEYFSMEQKVIGFFHFRIKIECQVKGINKEYVIKGNDAN